MLKLVMKGVLLGLVMWCWWNLVPQIAYEFEKEKWDDSPAQVNWEYIDGSRD